MKVGILTHYDVNNQGAQLQLYAMYKQLEALGHTPIVLTYRKNYDFVPELEKRNQISIRSIPYIIKNFLLKKGFRLTWHNVVKYITNKRFREKEFRYGSYCNTVVDAAIVGADEVFSLELGANVMMYGHGVNTNNMIAYAPSFGQTDLARIQHFHCKELISSGLSRFTALSARDANTQSIVNSLTGTMAPIVCDPVLLYKFPLDDYHLPSGTPRKDYLVVYSYDARFVAPEEICAIKTYAKCHNLITVSPGTFHKWCDVNICCNALEWLKCVQQAKCVITDTFHGTIASVITQRPMALYYSREVNAMKMQDLIGRLNLNKRLMSAITVEEIERVLSAECDWNAINSSVEQLRTSSYSFLCTSLNNLSK